MMRRVAMLLPVVAYGSESKVQWTGVNMAGFDYGMLGRASAVWCSDEQCDAGGWSDTRTEMCQNCPGYGGNNKTIYAPMKVCNGESTPTPAGYNGGFAAPQDFEGKNFGVGKGPTESSIPYYSRASPLMDEVRGSVEFGMNSFRVPFRLEYVSELWKDTWMAKHTPEYIPPFANYLQMVVDLVEGILSQKALPGSPPISVIFDMHNYMRWCPMGIGGTFSCLEPTGYAGGIRYQKGNGSSCPFTGKLPQDEACPKSPTSAQNKSYWDSPTKDKDFTTTPDYNMRDDSPWECPLDAPTAMPSDTRHDTCGANKDAAPTAATKDKQNPYAKLLTGPCFVRLWEKLLKLPVASKAFPGQCTPLHQVLAFYGDETKNTIHISLMNEPNMVDTASLAKAYHSIVTMMRGQFNLNNRLIIAGNYWAGLHAQVTPADRTSPGKCGAPSSETNGVTEAGKLPMQVIHEAIKDIPNLGQWSFDVHQYFDYFSTGNYDCAHGWKDSSCSEGTLEQVKEFVNWEPFMNYSSANDISIAVTEFAGHPSARCGKWIESFLTLLESSKYQKGKGGVLMWNYWRVCPHSSWYGNMTDPITNPSSDCLQFAPPQDFDPKEYKNLWAATSDPSLNMGMKPTLKKFVQAQASTVLHI